MPVNVETAKPPLPEDAAAASRNAHRRLQMTHVSCCVCGPDAPMTPVGVGEDFEYRTSPDIFLAVRCGQCGLVYLSPRPDSSEFQAIYPDNYHAFAFSAKDFGVVYRVRRRLEARRLLALARGLPADARLIDVGCGDGFHLDLLREFGPKSWDLTGVDLDERAVAMGLERGLSIQLGDVASVALPEASFDMAFAIQTIEHVASPPELLLGIRRLLKPGGRLVLVTDNTDSLDFALFSGRHWGGYHFPRHWNLFNRNSMKRLADKTGFKVTGLRTIVSPVNWTYSVRNALDDYGAPRWLVDQFSLKKPLSLGVFTAFDTVHQLFGQGALLQVVLTRPVEQAS